MNYCRRTLSIDVYFFASRAIDEAYSKQRNKSIPIDKLKFLRTSDESKQSASAKMIDFIEHQSDMLDLTKNECALVQNNYDSPRYPNI